MTSAIKIRIAVAVDETGGYRAVDADEDESSWSALDRVDAFADLEGAVRVFALELAAPIKVVPVFTAELPRVKDDGPIITRLVEESRDG